MSEYTNGFCRHGNFVWINLPDGSEHWINPAVVGYVMLRNSETLQSWRVTVGLIGEGNSSTYAFRTEGEARGFARLLAGDEE